MAEFNIEAVVSPSSKMKRSSCFRFWPVRSPFPPALSGGTFGQALP